jgi:predicted nucleic acid-binding protein
MKVMLARSERKACLEFLSLKPNLVHETRFFIEHFYSAKRSIQERTKHELLASKAKYVSVITLHEIHRLTLGEEGGEPAQLRVNLVGKEFKVVDVNSTIALKAAEIRHALSIPMADSIIAATCFALKATCVSDDPHFGRVRGLSTRWI